MSSIIPCNIRKILRHEGVEAERLELKASWDEKTTGYQILRTICAFANDYENLNGGYIVVGVAEEGGRAVLPPRGLRPEMLERIQKWIIGNCLRFEPPCSPRVQPEQVDGMYVLIIWMPGSEIRPHAAPVSDGEKQKEYYIRRGAETIKATHRNGYLPRLMGLTARVPFDDRKNPEAGIDDLRESRVREYLDDIGSSLGQEEDATSIYRAMKITSQANGHDVPRNIALLLFGKKPRDWFGGVGIEVVQFDGNDLRNVITEKKFVNEGIHECLRNALSYLEDVSSFRHIEKQRDSFYAKSWVSYPIGALREALVNAVYHRSYEADCPAPVEVCLYSDRIEVTSYPGPVPGLRPEHFRDGEVLPHVAARNRRVGEFLKDLKLAEGRRTGLPVMRRAMSKNGSPEPRFDFHEGEQGYFRVTLGAHPEYAAQNTIRDANCFRNLGRFEEYAGKLKDALKIRPDSPSLVVEYLRFLGERGKLAEARAVFVGFMKVARGDFHPPVTNVYIEILLDAGKEDEAKRLLPGQSEYLEARDAVDSAILARRMKKSESAHRFFEKAGQVVFHDARALLEFAQTKIFLARKEIKRHGRSGVNRRLLEDARGLLERVVQMETAPVRHAWAWREMARVNNWLRRPNGDVEKAYRKAIELLPYEQKFRDELRELARKRKGRGSRRS